LAHDRTANALIFLEHSKIWNFPKARFGRSSAITSTFPPEGKMNGDRNAPDGLQIEKGRLSPAFS
jgi:hypothetical protein